MRIGKPNTDALIRLQKFLIPISGGLSVSAVYIIWVDFEQILPQSVSMLFGFVLLTFLLSYAWTWIEYTKVQRLKEAISERESQKKSSQQHKLNQLSFKERDVLKHILAGKSHKEICAQLFIENSTLKSHINHIYKKLGVRSKKELILALK